jgi:hypothetical protein
MLRKSWRDYISSSSDEDEDKVEYGYGKSVRFKSTYTVYETYSALEYDRSYR